MVTTQSDEKSRVLEVRNVSKTFGATRALRHVEFSIDAGEVFAVLGQNGSGKSTLVKILSGFHEPDPGGEIFFDGEPLPLPVPAGVARERGMGFVYQDLGLVPRRRHRHSRTRGYGCGAATSPTRPEAACCCYLPTDGAGERSWIAGDAGATLAIQDLFRWFPAWSAPAFIVAVLAVVAAASLRGNRPAHRRPPQRPAPRDQDLSHHRGRGDRRLCDPEMSARRVSVGRDHRSGCAGRGKGAATDRGAPDP